MLLLICINFSTGNLHPDQITCLAVDAYLVFTACNNVIYAYTRGREVRLQEYLPISLRHYSQTMLHLFEI